MVVAPEPPDLGIPGLSDPVQIGTGGFAVVYRAFQPTFKRSVAVKVLTVEVDDQARRRFERECQALGALSEHPGIVTVHDAGFTSAGQPYLVMAYLAGGSLAERVAAAGSLGWESTLRLAKDPAGRPQSAAQLAQVLQDLSRRLEVQPDQDVSGPQTAPGADGEDLSATARLRPVTSDTAMRDASYATVASPAQHYQPTHRAPWTGMHAWSGPDLRLPVVAVLDPDLDVGVLGWHGDWAHIRCSNGWEAWVDGRLLVPFTW